ncbi:hypothetical protein [Bartonella rattimassiliensis]|uniref:Uncharacterized protein n=1 Tax=Bartonella rattimassiliensis 15908 TaxID=1094556 RepID=J0QPJ9_9HYPH|nr:hypothetical protein [Bartonella rattimassiliensis]EJF87666.1 hypothetical protein MCY_00120 [Bartonella rattimassiliensis 15908]
MSDHDIFIVIVGIIIIGSITYGLWRVGFGDTILLIIILGVLWFFEFSMTTLLSVAIIAYLGKNIILALANYHRRKLNEQLELKYRECAIYQNIMAQGEQRLFQKTRRIPKKWIKKWDEEVRHWERDLLKNPGHWPPSESSGPWPLMVEDICMQGYGEAWFLYETALTKELTDEHIKKINAFIITFKKTYLKAVRLMRKNRIILQKFVDPLTKKKRYKHTMLSLHWCLYVVDDMITAEYKQQLQEKASGHYDELAAMEIYFEDIPKYTEYEMLEEILSFRYFHMPGDVELLCVCKRALLLLLYDISNAYKAARKTFIYYKQLIDTVKEGYMAFDKDCHYSTARDAINTCKEKDKEKKKGLCVAKGTPTFEKAYKLGVKEWMKVANKKCDNRLIFWERLIEGGCLRAKLDIIFGDEKVKKLEEAINKNKKQFENKVQEAVLANNYLNYNESYAHLIQYLE